MTATGARRGSKLLAVLCLASAAASAGGQTIYRCGTEYRHQPCNGGRQLALEASAPDEAERAAAQGVAERQHAFADTLARDRARRESARVSGPAGIAYTPLGRDAAGAKPRATAKGRATQKRPRATDFEAVDPRTVNAAKKRHR